MTTDTVTCRVLPGDFMDFLTAYQKRIDIPQSRFAGGILPGLALGFATGLAWAMLDGKLSIAVACAAFGGLVAGVLLLAAITYSQHRKLMKAWCGEETIARLHYTIQVMPEGLHVHYADGNTDMLCRWRAVKEIMPIKDGFVIVIMPHTGIIVPGRDFPDEDAAHAFRTHVEDTMARARARDQAPQAA